MSVSADITHTMEVVTVLEEVAERFEVRRDNARRAKQNWVEAIDVGREREYWTGVEHASREVIRLETNEKDWERAAREIRALIPTNPVLASVEAS